MPLSSTRRGRTVAPPSARLRRLARVGPVIGVVCGVCTLAAAVGLVLRLVSGAEGALILGSLGQIGLYGSLAYGLGWELPRSIRGWDAALAERAEWERQASRDRA